LARRGSRRPLFCVSALPSADERLGYYMIRATAVQWCDTISSCIARHCVTRGRRRLLDTGIPELQPAATLEDRGLGALLHPPTRDASHASAASGSAPTAASTSVDEAPRPTSAVPASSSITHSRVSMRAILDGKSAVVGVQVRTLAAPRARAHSLACVPQVDCKTVRCVVAWAPVGARPRLETLANLQAALVGVTSFVVLGVFAAGEEVRTTRHSTLERRANPAHMDPLQWRPGLVSRHSVFRTVHAHSRMAAEQCQQLLPPAAALSYFLVSRTRLASPARADAHLTSASASACAYAEVVHELRRNVHHPLRGVRAYSRTGQRHRHLHLPPADRADLA
jgi:hypothetical protein